MTTWVRSMEDSDGRLALMHTSNTCEGVVAANSVLVVVAAFFAWVSLILAGVVGYLLGKHSALKVSREQGGRDDKPNPPQPPPRRSITGQESADSDGWPRLSRKDALRPVTNSRIHDLDTAQEALAQQGKGKEEATSTAIHAVGTCEPVQDTHLRGMPDALAAVYTNYISQWHDNEVPWKEPLLGQEAALGSRLASYASDVSSYLTRASSEGEAWRPLHYQPSETSQVAQLPFGNWEIAATQLAFCYTTDGELVNLGKHEEGGLIEIYKAVLDGKVDVAVKAFKIAKEAMPHEKLVELALQQMALNAAQHIVHFYGVCQTDDTIMLVYEHVEGGSVREAMKRDPVGLSWYNSGKAVARDAAQGLAFLHRHGMEHRSFKSSQVLVRPDSSAKIADAGLTVILRYSARSRRSRLATSFEWSAPELLLGQRCGTEADVFSFGIMLWELVTQEMPIRGALRDVRVPEECPSPIKCLISRCMASEPARRPTTNEIVDVIQRSWNMTRDGRGAGGLREGSSLRLRRSMLRTSRSQPLNGAKAGNLLTRPLSTSDARSPRDSVSEMIDYRRGLTVRRGTLQSAQSMGGATSSPTRWHPTTGGAVKHSAARPPISPASDRTSPQSSPEGGRLPPRRKSVCVSVGDRQQMFGLMPSAQLRPASQPPEMSTPGNKFMSPPRSFMQERSEIASAERRRRACRINSSHSAPAHSWEGSRDARLAADLAAELSLAQAQQSAKTTSRKPQAPQLQVQGPYGPQRHSSVLPPPQDASASMLVSPISSALGHGRDSPAKKRDGVEKKRDSVEKPRNTSLLEPVPPNPFSLARDAVMQAPSPTPSLPEQKSFDKSDSGETVFSHWLNNSPKSDERPAALTQCEG